MNKNECKISFHALWIARHNLRRNEHLSRRLLFRLYNNHIFNCNMLVKKWKLYIPCKPYYGDQLDDHGHWCIATHPKNYAHSSVFAASFVVNDRWIIPIPFRVTPLTLVQSYACLSASEAILRTMVEYIPWINSLGPSDAIRRQKTGSTLAQVMLVAWRHQAITRTNVDLSSVRSSDIFLGTISQQVTQPSITVIGLKSTHLKFH